jgi:hypothetical protein
MALDSAALALGRQSGCIFNHFMCLKAELRLPSRPREQIKCTYRPTASQSESSDHRVCTVSQNHRVKPSLEHAAEFVLRDVETSKTMTRLNKYRKELLFLSKFIFMLLFSTVNTLFNSFIKP